MQVLRLIYNQLTNKHMPKKTKLICRTCRDIKGERQGDKIIILRRKNSKEKNTIIKGSDLRVLCEECGNKPVFSVSKIDLGMTYCIKK